MTTLSLRVRTLETQAKKDGKITDAEALTIAKAAKPSERAAVAQLLVDDGFDAKSAGAQKVAAQLKLSALPESTFSKVASSLAQSAAKYLGPVMTSAPAAIPSRPLNAAEIETAKIAMSAQPSYEKSQAMLSWLKAHPDPAHQAEFMKMLKGRDDNYEVFGAFEAVTKGADQQVIADALNAGQKAGVLAGADFNDPQTSISVGKLNQGHDVTGEIMRRTGNPELIQGYVQGEMKLMKENWQAENRAGGMAAALSGLQPHVLSSWLSANQPGDADLILKNVNNIAHHKEQFPQGLGQMLSTLAKEKPASPEGIEFFESALAKVGDNPHSRKGVADFLVSHSDHLLSQAGYVGPNGTIESGKQKVLAEAYSLTLFSEPAPSNREALQASVAKKLGDMRTTLNAAGNADPKDLSNGQMGLALTMGSLVGTLEAGFQVAVDRIGQKNAATDGLVGLLDKLPDLPFPGGGFVKEKSVGKLKEWIGGSIKEKPQAPELAIPFNKLFVLTNSTLANAYISGRADAFMNSKNGTY